MNYYDIMFDFEDSLNRDFNKYNESKFALIALMEFADTEEFKLNNEEIEYLKNKVSEYGIDEDRAEFILESLLESKFTLTLPIKKLDKIELIRDLVLCILCDNRISNNEVALGEKITNEIGFNKLIFNLILKAKKNKTRINLPYFSKYVFLIEYIVNKFNHIEIDYIINKIISMKYNQGHIEHEWLIFESDENLNINFKYSGARKDNIIELEWAFSKDDDEKYILSTIDQDIKNSSHKFINDHKNVNPQQLNLSKLVEDHLMKRAKEIANNLQFKNTPFDGTELLGQLSIFINSYKEKLIAERMKLGLTKQEIVEAVDEAASNVFERVIE